MTAPALMVLMKQPPLPPLFAPESVWFAGELVEFEPDGVDCELLSVTLNASTGPMYPLLKATSSNHTTFALGLLCI